MRHSWSSQHHTLKEYQQQNRRNCSPQNVMHGVSFLSINHLTDIVKKQGKGTILQDIQVHRAKTSSLAKKVIGPGIKEAIPDDMKGQKYSVLINKKILAVCVEYFSPDAEKENIYQLNLIKGKVPRQNIRS